MPIMKGVLSLFLCLLLLCNHSIDSYAYDVLGHFRFDEIRSSYVVNGVIPSSGVLTKSFPLNAMFSVGDVPAPQGFDASQATVYFRSISSNVHIDSVSITGASADSGGVSVYGTADNSTENGSYLVVCTLPLINTYNIRYYSVTLTLSGSGSYSVTFVPDYFIFSFYRFSPDNSDSVTKQDVIDQTQDITHGYDSSGGDQVASDLTSGIDDYIKQEDQLYDQMQYEVPEVSLAFETQGIMLASNFLQSLYISNSFISKCVTFVLTFGLVLYIVGWLKKKS